MTRRSWSRVGDDTRGHDRGGHLMTSFIIRTSALLSPQAWLPEPFGEPVLELLMPTGVLDQANGAGMLQPERHTTLREKQLDSIGRQY